MVGRYPTNGQVTGLLNTICISLCPGWILNPKSILPIFTFLFCATGVIVSGWNLSRPKGCGFDYQLSDEFFLKFCVIFGCGKLLIFLLKLFLLGANAIKLLQACIYKSVKTGLF